MSKSEMTVPEDTRFEINAINDRSAGTIHAYSKRWERHREFYRRLDTILVETDAIWGNEFRAHVEPLKVLESELYAYISLYIEANLRRDGDLAKDFRNILKTKRPIIYDTLNENNDEYRKEFAKNFLHAEDYLRKKLGRKP